MLSKILIFELDFGFCACESLGQVSMLSVCAWGVEITCFRMWVLPFSSSYFFCNISYILFYLHCHCSDMYPCHFIWVKWLFLTGVFFPSPFLILYVRRYFPVGWVFFYSYNAFHIPLTFLDHRTSVAPLCLRQVAGVEEGGRRNIGLGGR